MISLIFFFILSGQYQALSQDPNSLSNLDQDLPNNMIHQVKYSIMESSLSILNKASRDRIVTPAGHSTIELSRQLIDAYSEPLQDQLYTYLACKSAWTTYSSKQM
jgi:hypothetical protein